MRITVRERELLEAGYRKVYSPGSEEITDGGSRLAKLERGQRVKPRRIRSRRIGLTEADLILALQKNGIGRPATYALVLEALLKRRYVEHAGGGLAVSGKGRAVLQFLEGNYPQLFSVDFTARMEEMLDEIACGKKSYAAIVGQLWRSMEKTKE